jgi:hypothetical protein
MTKERIPNPTRRETLLVKNGNTGDIIKSLMKVADMDYQAAQVSEFAQRFKGTDPDDQYQKLKELWKYTRKEITYEEDPEGKQLIKDPARVYWDNRKGDGTDCKSLSLFEYSVCRAIGVQCYFEFVSFFEWWEDKSKRITHVYPVAIVPGIGEVVLDAVYTRFDERPPGITRLVKKYTKVYSKMADIHHIQGIRIGTAATPTAKDLAIEANDRSKLVKPLSFVDYTIMSEGEMTTFLLAQRDKMLSEFFVGTPQGAAYAQQFLQKRDALYRGLHRGFNLLGGVKSKTRSASGWLTLPEKGVNLKQGFNFLFDDAESGAERVGAIPQVDCAALYPFQLPADVQWKITYNTSQSLLRDKCATENLWRSVLNAEWEKNGNVLIYEFLVNSQIPNNLALSSRDRLVIKADDQRDIVDGVVFGSKISRTNLRLWLENGCMQSSIQGTNGQSLGPQLPVDYINALRQQGQEGIGAFPLIVIPIALALAALNYKALKRLLGVIKGDQRLRDAVKSQWGDMQAFIEKYADEVANLASSSDWKKPDAAGSNCPPTVCNQGLILDPNTCECVPIPPPPPPGSGSPGFFANLSENEKIGLAAAAALLVYSATKR